MRWFLTTGFIQDYCSLMFRRNVLPTNGLLIKAAGFTGLIHMSTLATLMYFGPLNLFYHEENFPGMLVRPETLIRQAESPTLHYLLGGTRTNEYPTAFNYQIQNCGPLPESCTHEQWNKICDQAAETWYLRKKGATPTGLPRSTCSDVLKWTSSTNVLNCGCWNYGEIQGDHFIGGHHKVPRYFTDIPSCQDPEGPRYDRPGNHS